MGVTLPPRSPRPSPPLPPQKVKKIIYGAILLKFEPEHFHMVANNNWELRHFLQKVKFFTYCAILLKFETQHFHTFIYINLD